MNVYIDERLSLEITIVALVLNEFNLKQSCRLSRDSHVFQLTMTEVFLKTNLSKFCSYNQLTAAREEGYFVCKSLQTYYV